MTNLEDPVIKKLEEEVQNLDIAITKTVQISEMRRRNNSFYLRIRPTPVSETSTDQHEGIKLPSIGRLTSINRPKSDGFRSSEQIFNSWTSARNLENRKIYDEFCGIQKDAQRDAERTRISKRVKKKEKKLAEIERIKLENKKKTELEAITNKAKSKIERSEEKEKLRKENQKEKRKIERKHKRILGYLFRYTWYNQNYFRLSRLQQAQIDLKDAVDRQNEDEKKKAQAIIDELNQKMERSNIAYNSWLEEKKLLEKETKKTPETKRKKDIDREKLEKRKEGEKVINEWFAIRKQKLQEHKEMDSKKNYDNEFNEIKAKRQDAIAKWVKLNENMNS